MNLTVKHGKATHKFEFGLDNTVEDLKLRLEGLTNVDRSMQKLMYKGALKEGTLAANKVKNSQAEVDWEPAGQSHVHCCGDAERREQGDQR